MNGKLASISTELLGTGQRLAAELGQELSAVIIGYEIEGLAQEAIAYGAQKVYVVNNPLFKDYMTESYLKVMEKIIQQLTPGILLFGQTSVGRDLAPWLAFRLNTGVSMDCMALTIEPSSKRVLMTKPVYGGNAQAVQVCENDPQIATIRPKAMVPLTKDASRTGEIINIEEDSELISTKIKILDRRIETTVGVKLEDARVVICGGRGIGGAEGFKQLADLSNVLKGAVGASRPPCDNKWISDSQQIGITGKIISPDLYLAIGLSGSSQHLSGCASAKTIGAINKDPEANIFKVADYGIVADWNTVLPAFTAKITELVGQ